MLVAKEDIMFIDDEILRKVHKRASTLAFILMSLPIIFAIAAELFPPGPAGDNAPSFYPFLEMILIFANHQFSARYLLR